MTFLSHCHPGKCSIISCSLLLSPTCGSRASNQIYCLLVALKRHQLNCFCLLQNVFWNIGASEKLIMINLVCAVIKSLETPINVILYLPFWNCMPLGQIVVGHEILLPVIHRSVDRPFCSRHCIAVRLFANGCIQLSIMKHHLFGVHVHNVGGSLLMIWLSVHLFKMHCRSVWECRACI